MDEVLVCIRHFAFSLHAVDVDHVQVNAVEDLGTGSSPKGTGVGKYVLVAIVSHRQLQLSHGKWALMCHLIGKRSIIMASCVVFSRVFQMMLMGRYPRYSMYLWAWSWVAAHVGKGIEIFISSPEFIIIEGEEESVNIMGVDGIKRFQCQVESTSCECVTMFDIQRIKIA